MNKAAESKAAPVLDALAKSQRGDSATVVLVGSSARGTMHAGSDIDVLVIHDGDQRIRLDSPGQIHLQQDSRARFLNRLKKGDDYPAWALRFGVPVHDPTGWWAGQTTAELDSPHWPDWRPKANYATKRIKVSRELLDIGDVDAASEEMMFAASHVARAVLLKHGKFPLSRMEMPAQLRSVSPELSELLAGLIEGNFNPDALRSTEEFLARQLDLLHDISQRPASGEFA